MKTQEIVLTSEELVQLESLGLRLRSTKSKSKVERTQEQKDLISKALATGLYVTKGGGDGSKPRLNKGVGVMVRDLITQGLDNKTVLAEVKEYFGNNNTTMSCITWYRNDMKKKGLTSWVQQ